MKNTWIKIEDEYPERSHKERLFCLDGTYILKGYYGIFFKDDAPDFWTTDWQRLSNEFAEYEITHWQPIQLPE